MDVANKHNKLLKIAEVTLGEILDIADGDDEQDLASCYEKICELVKKLELSIENVKDKMLDSEDDIQQITAWSNEQKGQMKQFREARSTLKQLLVKKQQKDDANSMRKLYNFEPTNKRRLKPQRFSEKRNGYCVSCKWRKKRNRQPKERALNHPTPNR